MSSVIAGEERKEERVASGSELGFGDLRPAKQFNARRPEARVATARSVSDGREVVGGNIV